MDKLTILNFESLNLEPMIRSFLFLSIFLISMTGISQTIRAENRIAVAALPLDRIGFEPLVAGSAVDPKVAKAVIAFEIRHGKQIASIPTEVLQDGLVCIITHLNPCGRKLIQARRWIAAAGDIDQVDQLNVAISVISLAEDGQPALQQTQVEGLQILTSGPLPPNPADLLGSQKIDKVIASLVEQADVVLFDAPPVIAVTDAAVLGAKVDGVLLVISAGKTRREHAQRAKEMLEKANVRIVGAVLVDAHVEGSAGSYYGS